ncbi:MAG: hypothetical protein IV094_10265 [Vitreoscilla sp.]|nr:hypothetical protein [Vitreoscilla sp.]
MKAPLAAALILACMAPAGAATVYRCGQTYQQVPCAGASAVEVADPRSADQRKGAREAAEADRRQAKELAAERREREKAATPQREPMGILIKQPDEPASASAAGTSKPKPGKKGQRKAKPDTDLPRYVAPPTASSK